ncbi:MAG: 23S rRNA pseudouridine955/2504/2580 synthase [Pseudomonas sp.]|jgi:23S rRNA pseudouridine955/2504/2580 synthase
MVVRLHPTRIRRIGCRSQISQRVDINCDCPSGLSRLISQSLGFRIVRHLGGLSLFEQSVGRPYVRNNSLSVSDGYSDHPLSRLLLVALENIAVIIKCFKSIKNCYHWRMITTTSPITAVQLLEVAPELAGQRIDNFLRTHLKGVPKTLIYRILRKGEVRVNKGRIKPEYKLQAGDIIRVPPLRLAERDEPVPLAKGLLDRLEAAIVYEDKALIVLNKPAGIAVHGGSGLNYGVIEAFRQLRPDTKELELVHRLDRDTSGLLMIAKKRSMLRHLHAALRGDGIDKRYMALVRGNWPAAKKQVNAPLLKNTLRSGERMVEVNEEGKEALTIFKVLRRFGEFATLVEAKPITGRTHQIRVHALHAGHGIAGDDKYGDEDFSREVRDLGGKRLFLHAYALCVPLPDGGEMRFEAPVDEVWQRTIERLSV